VIKDVPAETCSNCHEPFMTGKVTDRVSSLLQQLKALHNCSQTPRLRRSSGKRARPKTPTAAVGKKRGRLWKANLFWKACARIGF
jgi:hypothetical protein